MFIAYRIEPVVEYEGSDESRETERFSTEREAWIYVHKLLDAGFEGCGMPDLQDAMDDLEIKLYWTLYGRQSEVFTEEAIADRDTEDACKELLTQIIGPYNSDANTGWCWPILSEPSREAQRKLLKAYFPWIDSNEEAEGSDAIDTLTEWWDNVGGEIAEPVNAVTPQYFMCQNCSTLYTEDELDPLDDVSERVAPGETMPWGQCPDEECAAVCYPPENMTPEQITQQLKEQEKDSESEDE